MLENLLVYPGKFAPLGFSIQEKRANFAVFSSHSTSMSLGLRRHSAIREVPMKRTGDIWHISLEGVSEAMEYAFKANGLGCWLTDPYSRYGRGTDPWVFCKLPPPFDWQNVPSPFIPLSDLVIYEMHVRGFTRSPSSRVEHPGTFLGMIEKIPYLLDLGVNAVELMPSSEFDETRGSAEKPNYWGYDPLLYFAPMRYYAATKDPVTEFKTLVRELHRNGIELILDVVYNHTGEAASLRGLDATVYYMVDENGKFRDYTGCKNTVNVNHPVTTDLILSSLHYWVEEMGVDGFRFDLASIFTRGLDGNVMQNPPLLKKIGSDPILSKVKLIAESWDATGLYQVGFFPHFGPWSEWNGKFRDRVRNFLKGTHGFSGKFADVFSGSEFLYRNASPLCSVNFVTAHDGFTLRDLVSYNQKHNMENGQNNSDGSIQNDSWNCGHEGKTEDQNTLALRERQMRNFLLALFLSQGIPMLLMGDEYGHTRHGNNNPFVQDNEINWFLWDELQRQKDIFEFTSKLIAFRKAHRELRLGCFLKPQDIDWHGEKPNHPNWNPQSRLMACTLKGNPALYIAFNADSHPRQITLPPGDWKEIVRTEKPWGEQHFSGPLLPSTLELAPYSAILAKGKINDGNDITREALHNAFE
jgi:isoamylase/glycogen operon protein